MHDLLLIGLLEFDGSMNPAVIVGDSHLTVYREALRQVQFKNPDGDVGLAVDDGGWLLDHPFPDTGDVMALDGWFTALMESELGDSFKLTIYAPPTEPRANAVMASVIEPHDAKWVAAFQEPVPVAGNLSLPATDVRRILALADEYTAEADDAAADAAEADAAAVDVVAADVVASQTDTDRRVSVSEEAIDLLRRALREDATAPPPYTKPHITTEPHLNRGPYKGYDHEARPDDDPEPGDRCKTCGEDITWTGPNHTDWLHVNDVRNS